MRIARRNRPTESSNGIIEQTRRRTAVYPARKQRHTIPFPFSLFLIFCASRFYNQFWYSGRNLSHTTHAVSSAVYATVLRWIIKLRRS